MNIFKRWLVGLDGSETDDKILSYLEGLAKIASPEEITFIHVQQSPDLPANILLEFPDLHEPSLQEMRNRLKRSISNYFEEDRIRLKVLSGNLTTLIFNEIKQEKPDLIVVGLKHDRNGPGTLTKKLSRKASGSLLVIPHNVIPKFEKIHVPVDFSQYSDLSMKVATNLTQSVPGAKLLCHHVYKNADWYLQDTFYTAEEVSKQVSAQQVLEQKLQEYSWHKLDEYLEKFHLNGSVQTKCSPFNRANLVYELILDEIKNYRPDLVVLGSKGESTAKVILLGSVAEKLVNYPLDQPLLMVRKKDENRSLLNFLLNN